MYKSEKRVYYLKIILSLIHIYVIGVTMQIWQDEDTEVQEAEGGCCGLSAVDDARRVAMDLSLIHI